MKAIGNFIWIILGGFIEAAIWFISGIILCCTIALIPFGIQCFKISGVVLKPFKKSVTVYFSEHPVMNFIWFIFAGWELFLLNFILSVVLCCTIVLIPFGKQVFKIAKLSAFPFGAMVSECHVLK